MAAILPDRSAAQATVDQVPRERTITTAERVEADLQRARLRLGPLRVIPMIVITNAGYDNNVFSRPDGQPKVGDWTVTAGVGGRAILPVSSKLSLRLLAVPEYIWYDELKDRRTWGGNFAASFLALGNRLSFEATGTWDKGSTILSSETQATVVRTAKSAGGKLEIDLTRALSFVAAAEIEQDRHSPQAQDPTAPIDVESFDRTDTAVLAGLRLRLTSALAVLAGVQGSRTEFIEQPELRDNETYAILGGIHLDRPKFFVNLAGGYRKGRSFHDSLFPAYNATVGSYFLSWRVVAPVALEAFGHRRPVYSASAVDQLYIETRYGGGLRLRLGQRVSLQGHGEAGTNSYLFSVLGGGGERVDDAVSFGGGLSVRVFGTTVVRAQASRTILKPAAGGTERRVFRVTTGLSFNGEFSRE